MLTASLAPISNLTVPAQQGYTVPLDGSGDHRRPDVHGDLEQSGHRRQRRLGAVLDGERPVHRTRPTPQNNFSGPLVFQLFNNAGSTTLTPNTVSHDPAVHQRRLLYEHG